MAEIVVRAERMAAGGDALAHEPGGRVVFVDGALPGELVRARHRTEKRDYARATVVEVLEESPGRIDPPCPVRAQGCGGCGWQHADVAHQRAWKREVVLDALRRTAHLEDVAVVAGPPLDPWAHRTTLRLAVAGGRAGFRRHRRHDVVEVPACLVAHPRLADVLATGRFPGATEVVLRASAATGERLALTDPPAAVAGASLPPDVATGPEASFTEVVAGVALRVSAPSFFQARPDGAAALVAAADRALAGADRAARLADLYGGVGLFAAALAWPGPVTVVEVSPSSVADARHNLPAADVGASTVEAWAPVAAGAVVADPPRSGLDRAGVAAVAATGAPVLALVSCDPVSLARDAALLAGEGYRLEGCEVVDLFPHTPHVEVVSRFVR